MILSVSLSFFFSLSHFARLSLLLSQQLFFTRLTLGNGMCIYELISIRWFFEIEKGNSLICAQRRNIDALNGLSIFQKYCIPVNGIKKHMPKLLKRVRKWQACMVKHGSHQHFGVRCVSNGFPFSRTLVKRFLQQKLP